MGLLGGLGKKALGGLGTMATIGGMAILTDVLLNERETKVVHEYVDKRAEREEERRERAHERQMERERKQREKENPNAMEFVNERVNQNLGLFALFSFCIYGLAFLLVWLNDSKLYTFTMIIIGVLLLYICYYFYNKNNHLKKYISLILIQNYRSIIEIANQMNCSYEEALNNVTKVIAKGYIKGFYIDKNKKMLFEYKKANRNNDDSSVYENATNFNTSNEKRICRYCGGNKFETTPDGLCCKYCGGRV